MTITQGGSRFRLRKALGLAAILIGMVLSVVGIGATPAVAADVNPTAVFDVIDGQGGNATCAQALAGQPGAPVTTQLGGQGGFTSDGPHTDGVLSVAATGFGAGSLTWSVTGVDPNVRVYAVLIKQTNATRVYYYAPGVPIGDGDSGLVGVNNGVSNYKFCYAIAAAPPPPPPPLTADVTLAKTTSGNAPALGTLFRFTVVCDSGNVPVNPVDIASAAPAVVVATDVVVGDTCTITETVNQGATTTVYTVDGTVQPAGAQVVVTVTSTADVVVSAANDFPAAGPGGGGGGPVVAPPAPTPVVTPPLVLPEVITPPVVLPEVITPPVVLPEVVSPPVEVGGVVVPRELPRTGTTTLPLLQVGLGLILLGAGALLFGRERTALI